MAIKDIKDEARKKLALNMHQAIAVYTVEFTLMITLIALIVMSWVALGVNTPAAIVMICYGVLLALIAFVGIGMANFAMVDFYLASYRCKPYNIRRLGETLARSNVVKIFLLNLQRTALAFLLLLCLIVPGVIYLVRTSMANYLLIANPKMTAKTAIAASNKVMSGKTGAYFSLCMSLLGWYLLGGITLGLGFIFILPYTNLIKATYYKRNLQGDKAVYTVPAQPVSPPMDGMQTTASPNTVGMQQQQAAPQQAQQVVMPIDTLEDEDLRNMNATMRGFGSQVVDEPEEIVVPEVPIMPVSASKSVDAEPVIDVSVSEPEMPKNSGKKIVSHSIDGTNIVETERELTTIELEEQEAAKQQAIDGMYTHTEQKKPIVDYFAQSAKNSPDDFVTREVDLEIEQTPAESVIDEEPIMSDSELDAFLKEFDSEMLAEAEASVVETQKPREKSDRRATPASNQSSANERRVPPRRSVEHNGTANERAERIRREREERLQKLKK